MASYERDKKTGKPVLKAKTETPDQAAAQAAERAVEAKPAKSPEKEAK